MTSLPQKTRPYLILTFFIAIALAGWFITRGNIGNDESLYLLIIIFILTALLIFRENVLKKPKESSPSIVDKKNIKIGLNYQGIGNLEVAFAIFKKCRPNAKIISLLSNLAQDFEIVGKDERAFEIYQHILSIDPNHNLANSKMASSNIKSQVNQEQDHKIFANDPDSPTLINQRYQLYELLGKGTDSSVYLAIDHENNMQKVAIKILSINYDQKNDLEKELLARFQREAETAASLHHKNIIRVLGSGQSEDTAFMVMEYINGKSLREYSYTDSLLPLPLIIELIAQCADGLHYAHGLGIIHRDVKPANILYDQVSKTAKLGDFGIARVANSTQTLAGSFLGTPYYMSPEQLESQNIDERSDIFSLGGTLFRLVSGIPPFSGHSIADLMIKIVNQPHKDLKSINPEFSAELIEVIDVALAKNPNDRFKNAQEFSNELRKCL
ncbi:MAG: serine/threonine-protein kinase [Pseudomonadota bacterium]